MPVTQVTAFRDFFLLNFFCTPVIMQTGDGNAWVRCQASDDMMLMAKLKFQGITEIIDTSSAEYTDCPSKKPAL
jgi:hypothetical protein